jgi:hypothetical protein
MKKQNMNYLCSSVPHLWLILFSYSFAQAQSKYFAIQVLDDQTNRGVPLVQLETTNARKYFTDSAGFVAFYEPGMMEKKVFFTVTSHGYEYPADGFGMHGVALDVKPGGSATIKIHRHNIAERLYRITGEGIYRDSVLLGKKSPTSQPLINANVVGQDSNLATVYRGEIYWFWGDTAQSRYPLGNFQTTGATSELPSKGGLQPSVGVDLHYFGDGEGFVKHMVPLPDPGPVWIDGLMNLKDDSGTERLLAHYSRMKDLGTRLARGLIVFSDEKQCFDQAKSVDLNALLSPGGQPLHVTVEGQDYFYFAVPYPVVRTKANWKSVMDLSSYEAYTCLAPGARCDKANTKLDRDKDGKLMWSWKKDTPPLDPGQQKELEDLGVMKRDESPFRLQNADDGTPIQLHGGSVNWNAYRKCFILIGLEAKGTSNLGEIWYAEATSPVGPWVKAKKIVTHNRMDFYNPLQHPFFDEDGGRIIYFEGTYTNSFSGNPEKTPGYEYNQIMYRLDLSDARLKPAYHP